MEGVRGTLSGDADGVQLLIERGDVAIIVDPETTILRDLKPVLLVDAIVAKRNLGTSADDAPAVVALGPGFLAGRDAHAVIETCRGHTLGRVITEGEALPNTGVPGEIGGRSAERVLRSPVDGVLRSDLRIGAQVRANDVVACVDDVPVCAPIDGVLRGLLAPGPAGDRGHEAGRHRSARFV